MPIDPKQQPPYYKPAAMPTPTTGGDLIRLNTQYTDEVTSGTSETTMYEYEMPANTLSTNGDTIKIYYTATNIGAGVMHRHRPYLNNNQYASIEDTGATDIIIKITIIRDSTSTARITIEYVGSIYKEPIIQTENLIDWTVAMPIKLTAQCPTTGSVQSYSLTIDKISN